MWLRSRGRESLEQTPVWSWSPRCDFKAPAWCRCCNDSFFFFCPEQAGAHTNFSHCSHFVGCNQFCVIWPLWFPPHQCLCCVRASEVLPGMAPALPEVYEFLDVPRAAIADYLFNNYSSELLSVIIIIICNIYIYTLQSNNWKGRGEESDVATPVKNDFNFHGPRVLYCRTRL